MLDGILTRGFSSRWFGFFLFLFCMYRFCYFEIWLWFWDEWSKSLVKATRMRIEVVRRRAESKQRFLKEDLAKLLDNGLDINAYGRVDSFFYYSFLLLIFFFTVFGLFVSFLIWLKSFGSASMPWRKKMSFWWMHFKISQLPLRITHQHIRYS